MHNDRHDRIRRARASALACTIALIALGTIPGCVSSAAKDRVSAAQRDAISRLRVSYIEDLAVFRGALGALTRIEIETRLTQVETAIASRYLTGSGDADTAALDTALASPSGDPAPDALIAAVRVGTITPERARSWLSDYALAWRMTDSRDARRRLIDMLGAARDLTAAHDALLAAFDARAAAVAALFVSIAADSDALERARSLEREFADPSRARLVELWRARVLDRVGDPDTRRLLDRIIAAAVPAAL